MNLFLRTRTRYVSLLALLFVTVVVAKPCLNYSQLKVKRYAATDFDACSCWQLNQLRNEIFARHGYDFKRFDLHELFSSFDWYHPREKMTSLNRYESANARTLYSQEIRRGCLLAKNKAPATAVQKTTQDIFHVVSIHVDAHAKFDGAPYKMILLNRYQRWALVRVLPMSDLQTLDVVLKNSHGRWVVKAMATYVDEWERSVPELFK